MNRKICNDLDVIEQVLAGNTDAFSELVRKYQGMVVGLAFHHVGNLHDAEDIGQEVFIQAYRRLSQLKQRDKFASWLRRIAENHCKTWLRLNQKERHMLELDETLVHPVQKPPEAILLDEVLSETVRHAIARLSEPNRLAVTLYYMQGASYKELSEFLDIGISAVKGRLHKARQQLKKGLWTMVENDVSKKKPKEAFTQRVMEAIVVGRVITLGGKPIHGASLEIREYDAETHGRELQTQIYTDTDGRYRYPITAPEQSIYSLRAKHPEFEESQESRFVVETAGELGMTDLVLKPSPVRTVRGKVTDESGNPIERAFLCSIYHRFEKGDENAAATDAAGEYTIDKWVNDRPLLYAKADGYTAGVAHLNLVNHTSFSIDFALKPAVETSGRVIDETGEPVEQAYVGFHYPRQQHGILYPWSTYTNADGRFCISGLLEGTMRVYASHDDYHDDWDDWQEITSGDTDVELVLRPITVAKIVGQVVDAETGNPITDFTYFTDGPYEPSENRETTWKGLERLGCHVTSKSGEFTTNALNIDSECDVIVTADGYAPFRIGNVVVGCEPLRFSLERGRTVHGRVVNAETIQPIANATVRHFCAERPLVDMRDVERLVWYGRSGSTCHEKQGGQSTVTDTAGRFVLNTLGRMGGYLYIEPPDGSQHAPSVVGPIQFDDKVSEIGIVIMCNTGGTIQGSVPELPADEIAHYRNFYVHGALAIESVWLVSDEIPHLKIERGLLVARRGELNLEEMGCDESYEIPDSREFTFSHVMPGRWRLEHCTHDPDFLNVTEEIKTISLQIEKGETITEPFKTLTYDGDHEPEIQPDTLDFGTVCSGSAVEAHLVLHGGLSISSSTMATWLRFDTAWLDSRGRWRIDITADTSTIGTQAGTIRFQTDAGEFTLPTSISVIESGSPLQKILWTDTPFDGFSGMSTALLDELIRSHHLDIDFTRKIPRNLELYHIIFLTPEVVYDIWLEDVMRLQNFVEAGGRLVVGADNFFRGSVEGLNKIVHTYGFKMLDIEPIREVDVEIDAAQFQTDWQRNLFADVDRLHFFRPSPIVVDNRDAFCIRHPDDHNLIYASGVQVKGGQVFVIGQSLLLKFFSKTAGNQQLLANLLTNPPT